LDFHAFRKQEFYSLSIIFVIFLKKANFASDYRFIRKYILFKMQYIELKGMNFHARHGVMEQERIVGNTFTVDLKLEADFSRAIQSDRLEDTLNYALIYDAVKEEMQIPSQLLEHVAGRIIRRIKRQFPAIDSVEIRLAKHNPPVCGEVREAAIVLKSS
jgi:dihydroneopterin aldolase